MKKIGWINSLEQRTNFNLIDSILDDRVKYIRIIGIKPNTLYVSSLAYKVLVDELEYTLVSNNEDNTLPEYFMGMRLLITEEKGLKWAMNLRK